MEQRGRVLSDSRRKPGSFDKVEGTTSVRRHILLTHVLGGKAVTRQADAWGGMSIGHLLPFNYPAADKK